MTTMREFVTRLMPSGLGRVSTPARPLPNETPGARVKERIAVKPQRPHKPKPPKTGDYASNM